MNIKKTFALTGMLLVVIVSSLSVIYQFEINNDNYLKNHNVSLSKKIKENELKIKNINNKIIESESEKEISQKNLEQIKSEKEKVSKSEKKEIKKVEVKNDLKSSDENPEDILIKIIEKSFPLLLIPFIIFMFRNIMY